MSLLKKFQALLQDPPPEFAFEISAGGVAMARTDARTGAQAPVQFAALPPGTLKPNPVSNNVVDAPAYAEAIARLIPPGLRGKKRAALILPDNSARVAILDFDQLPDKEEERRALIRFRLRKTLPFDVDTSAVSYNLLGPKRVLVAVSPHDVTSHFEAPFLALGIHPGLLTLSSLSMLELIPPKTTALVAKRSAGVLTVTAVQPGGILLIRSLDLDPNTADVIEEFANDLFPTLAYIEDNTGARPGKLLIAGFGPETAAAATRLAAELGIQVEAISENHPGLAGYLASVSGTAPAMQVAA